MQVEVSNYLSSWLNHRIRMCIWKQWKKPKTKKRNLIKLGIPKYFAHQAANSRKKHWYVSGMGAVNRALTKDRLKNSGLYDLVTPPTRLQSIKRFLKIAKGIFISHVSVHNWTKDLFPSFISDNFLTQLDFHSDEIPLKNEKTAYAWFYGKLLIAAICESFVNRGRFSPKEK